MAQLFLFDQIFTHFEREEDIHNLRGKLHDDLFRLHETLSQATSRSIIIMNEVFNSTSLTDAVFLSTKTLEKIIELDVICVCVTFIDELAKLSDFSVTMASNADPDNLVERTYKSSVARQMAWHMPFRSPRNMASPIRNYGSALSHESVPDVQGRRF